MKFSRFTCWFGKRHLKRNKPRTRAIYVRPQVTQLEPRDLPSSVTPSIQAVWVYTNEVTDPSARQDLVNQCVASGLNTIYISVYQSTPNSTGRYMYPDADMAALISLAHSNGIQVWADYGAPDWPSLYYESGAASFPMQRLNEVIAYDQANPTATFDGVMLDEEFAYDSSNPASYDAQENTFLRQLLPLDQAALNLLQPAKVQVGATCNAFWNPNFLSNPADQAAVTITFAPNGTTVTEAAYLQLIDLGLNQVVVLGYRDFAGAIPSSEGEDGIIGLDQDEINYAANTGSKTAVLAGLETQNITPSDQTFYSDGNAVMNSVMQTVAGDFGPKLGGFAIDAFENVYLSGQPGWPRSLPDWVVNEPGYNQTITASGGMGSVTFSSSGTLPPGLMLSTAGVLSGTPTTAGTYMFTVTATDTVGASVSQSYTVTIRLPSPIIRTPEGIGILVPAYFYPMSGGYWDQLAAAAERVPLMAILNPDSGPGSAFDPNYGAAVDKLRAAGGAVIGYVDTAYGTGGLTQVEADINAYMSWYHLDGIFLDEMANDANAADRAYYQQVYNYIHGLQSNWTVAGNPGTSTLADYAANPDADNLVVFEDGSGFSSYTPSPWQSLLPGQDFTNLVYNVSSAADMQADVNQAVSQHTGWLYVTDATLPNPYDTLPSYWTSLVGDVAAANQAIVDGSAPTVTVPTSTYTITGSALPNSLVQIYVDLDGDGQIDGGDHVVASSQLTGGNTNFAIPTPLTPNAVNHFLVTATDASGNQSAPAVVPAINQAPPTATFTVSVPAGIVAGQGFLVTVQAETPISTFSGTVYLTTTDPQVPTLPPITLTNGLGYALVNLGQGASGPWTITATTGSDFFTGTSSPITVSAGPAVKLAFTTQPVNTPTGVALPTVTVQVEDVYGNVVTTDNTDTVTLGIASGPGSFTAGSTTSVTVHNGVATFNHLTLVKPGNYTLSEVVTGLYTGLISNSFTIAPLQVVPGSFVGTPSGFSFQFNAPILVNSTTPVLYGQGFGTTAPAPSGTLIGPSGLVAGSLLVNTATNSITFVETDTATYTNTAPNSTPILADGAYTVDLSSSAAKDGFQALNSGGGFLDGKGSGTPGSGDYMATFTVGATAANDDVLWVPATADGPGQALSAPGKNQIGAGYPVYLDDHAGTVTDVEAMLSYNPSLLTVTPTSTATFTVTVPSAGTAVLRYSGPPLSSGTRIPIGFIAATVPAGTPTDPTPYKAKDLLVLSGVSVNGGAIPSLGSDALHLVAYVGDADGHGSYSSNDAVLITRALLSADSGFAAYPQVDPVIVADTDGAGFIPADAAFQANEAGVGYSTANLPVPPIPPGVVFQAIANNVDPSISLPTNLQLGANGTVMVPVSIDDAHPAGSTGLIEAHLALTYDPRAFTLSAADVHPGSLLAGSGWSIVPTIDQVTGQIGIALSSSTPISRSIGGSLVTIDFHQTGTTSGAAPFELVVSADPNGQYVATELEDAQGTFTLSPAPTNGFDPRIDGVVVLAPAPAAAQVSIPGIEAAAISSTVADDTQPTDSLYVQAVIVSAGAGTNAAPIEGSEQEAPAVPTVAAVGALAHVTAAAASSSLASMTAGTPVGLLGALIGQVSGAFMSSQISTSQPLGVQFFQALGRWITGPADTVVPSTVSDSFAGVLTGQLLPIPPTPDALDNLNWDEVSSDARDLLDRHDTDDGRFLLAARSLADADQITCNECFAQMGAAMLPETFPPGTERVFSNATSPVFLPGLMSRRVRHTFDLRIFPMLCLGNSPFENT